MIEEREKEITAIVQSISEINEMYRDLATMVVDQVRAKATINYAANLKLIMYNVVTVPVWPLCITLTGLGGYEPIVRWHDMNTV